MIRQDKSISAQGTRRIRRGARLRAACPARTPRSSATRAQPGRRGGDVMTCGGMTSPPPNVMGSSRRGGPAHAQSARSMVGIFSLITNIRSSANCSLGHILPHVAHSVTCQRSALRLPASRTPGLRGPVGEADHVGPVKVHRVRVVLLGHEVPVLWVTCAAGRGTRVSAMRTAPAAGGVARAGPGIGGRLPWAVPLHILGDGVQRVAGGRKRASSAQGFIATPDKLCEKSV
jgi:hypothetical protein